MSTECKCKRYALVRHCHDGKWRARVGSPDEAWNDDRYFKRSLAFQERDAALAAALLMDAEDFLVDEGE